MLLKRNSGSSNDEGVALIAVVSLTAACALLLALMAASAIYGFGTTSASRADVQSQSAAQAGVAAASVGMNMVSGSNTCSAVGGVYSNAAGTTPVFSAKIYKPNGTGGWDLGCPVDNTTQVRIVSQGAAADKGVQGRTAYDSASVETILGPSAGASSVGGTGPAVYSNSSSGFGASGTLVSIAGSSPSVMVASGDVACSGASSGAKDLVVATGSVTLSGSCSITGSVWSAGSAAISGGVVVGGNLVANGVSINSGTVGGGVWSASGLSLSGGSSYINGNSTSQSLTFNSGGKISGSAWVYGTATRDWGSAITGGLTAKSIVNPTRGSVGSQTTIAAGPGASPYATPVMPTVPTWIDFKYDATAWPAWPVRVVSGATCNTAAITTALAGITGPAVLDGRGCTNGIVINGSDIVSFPADLAVFAKKISVTASGGFKSTAAAGGRLWLITEDTTMDGTPTNTMCPSNSLANQSIYLDGNPQFTSLAVMIYTPCRLVVSSGVTFNGQMYVGQAQLDGGATVGFVPVGLPGYNMTTGSGTTGATSTLNRQVVSTRNIQTGG
ncbi:MULTISPECIES: hypothetical protein [unclassified Cryobacterium]|uniref:hypothetical protein n=1 Tax=unclassified Cryobacterium TaxID=2649013 RepID=UPI002AB4CDDF|nr:MULTISPECIES: hypothetical protein [unclassified Cryobacterium]MDY7541560.1 hypothetical protein [Cryobacterium sp. 5B3]MEA9998033.1 hypothetical protein [Cryobacterium sp. RTS3]MEB0267644.1 hypothetical protein [Cryobacterium sp. 10I5]MEB0274570.1 hypothetical protein [Cryobacterium sp. 5B3]